MKQAQKAAAEKMEQLSRLLELVSPRTGIVKSLVLRIKNADEP